MKKILLVTAALTALAATPAFAKTHHSAKPMSADPADESYAAAPASGVTAQGPAVYSFGHYAGWDPDPNIRFQLMRDAGDLAD